MLGQWWIVLSMVIVACNAIEIQCPEHTCSCHPSHNSDTEVHCATANDSAFIVNADPYKYIQVSVTCVTHSSFSESRAGMREQNDGT